MIGICLLFLYIEGLAKWAFPSSVVKIVLCIFLRFLKGRGGWIQLGEVMNKEFCPVD